MMSENGLTVRVEPRWFAPALFASFVLMRDAGLPTRWLGALVARWSYRYRVVRA